MFDRGVILPGPGGHINGSNSAKSGKRGITSLTEGYPCETCGSTEAMASIFGTKRYRDTAYKSYKEEEFSALKPCGKNCDCNNCQGKNANH